MAPPPSAAGDLWNTLQSSFDGQRGVGRTERFFLRSAHSNAAPKDAPPPALIAERYRVESTLGRGGAARLYRVTELTSGKTLALKLLHSGVHPKLRELFELEYQTLASLEHPRTPRVFEFGSDALGVFYTMELLEGEDLRSSAPLPWRTVCDHLLDASQALGVLHARGLIHRDVSPRNLWRTPDGRIKLIDFGAIAPFGPSSQVIGTPPLIPPEALARRPLDQRADLYALGGVAYFLLTGEHAFPAISVDALAESWQQAPLPPSLRVEQLNRRELEPIPEELDALVLALLSGNELVRPSSTAEVIDRIDALRGTRRDSEHDTALARLTNVAYVGRTRERRRLARRFTLAARGRGQACVLEGAKGSGRSRALKELELTVRVAQAHVLHATSAADGGLYGVADALALALLD
ncbi:MAG TPA: serine/threonine-protein kinase, partial [Polyangiales bacterium]|nr:serine/threonine-protein kinase [Polyangiales bacterium]